MRILHYSTPCVVRKLFRVGTHGCFVAALAASTAVAPVVVTAQETTSGDARGLATEKGSVAVGPFVNISGRPSDDWIGYGIAETLSADLQQLTTLSVISRDALDEEFSLLPGRPDDLEQVAREISQELGVRWLIVGGYQRINDQVRITARVVETETGRIETVTRVDGSIAELFDLQDQIVAELGEGFRALTNAPMVTDGAMSPNQTPSRSAVPTPTDVPGGLSLDPSGVAGFGIAEGAGILTGRPTLRPGRSDTRPEIDGRLNDVIWQDALHITEFVQQTPVEGAPATEDTDVWIAYDSQNLYIAVHAHYSDPSIMRANRVDRDQSLEDDNVSFYFDTFLDQQRAYLFSVNGYGVQGDAIVNARGGGRRGNRRRSTGSSSFNRGGIPTGDNSWDALFSSSGQTVDDGYTAEVAIPFKSLRYPQREQGLPHRWGFQIVREVRGKDEFQVWAPITRNVSGFLTQSGLLEGMTNLSLSRNLEVMPTFTGVQYGSLSRQGKFVDGDPSPEGGVNLKYGITSNLIADFAYNPDFSQIESDLPQIEVNQRFSLFYPELRPFFLEGAEIFSPARGMVTFVNTRTIVDPEFGGKVTGKVGNTTVGFMVANDEAPGRTDSSTDIAFGEKANNIIGRARYDLYAESYIGALVTHREFLDSHSTLGLLDGNFRLGQTQSMSFQAVQTDHRDLEQVDREGQMFNLSWRFTNRHWNSFASLYTLSPNFRTDVGFVRRVDQKQGFTSLGYTFRPESWIVSWGPSVRYNWNHDFDNVLQDLDKRVAFDATFARNISVSSQFQDEMERFRGINFQKQSGRIGGQVSTSRRVAVGGYYGYGDLVRYVENPFLGRGSTGSFFASLRPLSRFQSEINLRTSDFIDPRTGEELVFDVKILRALSTYQFTDRFLLRNISEYNTFDKTVDLNLLFTYRLNAGTVFYIGYDDHYRQADQIYGDDMDGDGIDDQLFPMMTMYQQTNRAVFTKFQYLFRF